MARSINYQKGEFLTVPNKSIVLKLRGATLNVYLSVVGHAGDDGKCFPSYSLICDETGYKRRQVIEAMSALTDMGLLKKNSRSRKDGTQTSNSYQLQILYTEGAEKHTPRGAPERTPASAPERTPMNSIHIELNPTNSKDWDFEKKKAYAIACEQDRALAKREAGRISPSNKGSFGSVGDVIVRRFSESNV